MKHDIENIKDVEKYFNKNTSLIKYLILRVHDLIQFLLKTILVLFFPIVIFFICAALIIFLKIDATISEGLTTTLFSAGIAFYLAVVGLLLSLLLSKNSFFKTKLITIFFNVKILGLYPVISAFAMNTIYLIMSLYYLLVHEGLNVLIGSISSIVYSSIILIFAFVFLTKDDEKRYSRFLKNNNIFRKKRKSQIIRENPLFGIEHPKFYKFSLTINLFSNMDATALNINIPESIEPDIKFGKIEQYKDKVKLLCYYLENYSIYVQTEFDVLIVTDFFNNINNKVIIPLLNANEFDLVGQVYISSSKFLENFKNSEFCRTNDCIAKILKCKDSPNVSSSKVYAIFMLYLIQHFEHRCSLSYALLDSMKYISKMKTKNRFILSLQKYIIPVFNKIDPNEFNGTTTIKELTNKLLEK